MRRCIVLFLLVTIVSAIPTYAQESDARFVWEPYEFSLDLPEGWTASATAEELILGLPDDVRAVEAGQTPAGVVMVIMVIEPVPFDAQITFLPENYSPFEDESEERTFGDTTWWALEVPPVGDRQGLIAQTGSYLLSASGPVDDWADALPLIETLIASIDAALPQRSPADHLTQPVQWRDLRFRVPANMDIVSAVPDADMVWLTSYENRLLLARTFKTYTLYMTIRDFSPVRHLFMLESLLSLDLNQFYQQDNISQSEIVFSQIGGFEVAGVTFTTLGGEQTGQALTLRSPDSLYLWVSWADTEYWEATERDLFEAVLDTLEYAE